MAGQNKGWPCFEGPARTPEYSDLPGGEVACPPLLLPGAHSGPAGFYGHPQVVAPLVSAISCIAGDAATGAVFFADYVLGWVKQVPLASLLAGNVDLLLDAAVTNVCDHCQGPRGDDVCHSRCQCYLPPHATKHPHTRTLARIVPPPPPPLPSAQST